MTTRRAPELYSFGKYYAAASARVLCSTHTQQGPRIRSRETAAPWVIKSLAPNIFFRVCVCVYVRRPKHPTQPPAEGITTAAIAFQPKACRPLTPALGLVSEKPRPDRRRPGPRYEREREKKNPTQLGG